jgi:hypothetical protein
MTSRRGPGPGNRRTAILGLLALAASAWAGTPAPAGDAGAGSIDAALPPVERAQSFAALSARLVELAQSAKANATSFRIDVAHYRESLRDLVKENDKRADADRLPRPLLMDLVRMAGLLQSAAECQTGRYIVCPPDLMVRLRRQQALVEQGLASLPVTP